MYRYVIVDDRGPITVFTLNRPDKLNALGPELRAELLDALRKFNSDPNKRVGVLTGAGRAFSSGAEISVKPSGPGAVDLEGELRNSFHLILREIRFSDKLFIAAVNGVAAGAGISLAVACDFAFASRNARFVLAFQNLGIVPDTGLTLMMARLVGARALRYLLIGGEFTAEEAEAMGLVKVVDDPLGEALKFANEIVQGPFRAYSYGKRLINEALFKDLDQFLAVEARLQGELGNTHDFVEGVSAFLEKRRPRFTGS
ncbi:enoyl-CoA hydratase-related protein [Vulcanisaeta distributa]|uniref:Enoyl-CoA hydratase/isomerase n=1 Tax=Vulcanisaeta distributa (strain DSM 14429 / JCM 11212 / NBRC 100878 / IC-017) TaxID=572478 RepID=E1QT72_VULDI|nr:enoyl-CoA hydratase-related protein [Vulcanisaeta distributa]ADN49664.1 Enoyl-CoA hydratase/isomerase [Vulcanisaeta distributa DSM 14429]